MIHVEIRELTCRGCAMCVDICPARVFEFDPVAAKARVAAAEDCVGCMSCGRLCPSGAVRHEDYLAARLIGVVGRGFTCREQPRAA